MAQMANEQKITYKKAKTSVWWDLNNCHCQEVPMKEIDIPSNICAALLKAGYEGPVSIFIYGDLLYNMPHGVPNELYDSEIITLHNFSDAFGVHPYLYLRMQIFNWAYANSPSCNIMIISDDDENMLGLIEQLRMMKVNVLLAHTDSLKASNVLPKAANKVWLLNSLLAGGLPYKPFTFNHAGDRPYKRNTHMNLVDQPSGLVEAFEHIRHCLVIGVYCEGSSFMQIGTEEDHCYLIDLVKLSKEIPNITDSFLKIIFCSPQILKIGYNFQCDMEQLAQAYGDFDCFKHFENVLDLQLIFKEHPDGLYGLAKEVLGVDLCKTRRRNINWENIPLTSSEFEYVALDALRLYSHLKETKTLMELESHTISRGRDPKPKAKGKQPANPRRRIKLRIKLRIRSLA